MGVKPESDWEGSNSSRGVNARGVSSRGHTIGASGAASTSNEAINECKERDQVLMHRTKCLDHQAIGSSRCTNCLEVVEGEVAPVVEKGNVTLRKWLDKPGRSVDLSECLHIFRQIVEIVNLAHSRGIVVHNVKPSCFVLSAFNRVSLVESTSCSNRGSGLHGDALNSSNAKSQGSPLLHEFQHERSRTLSMYSRLAVSSRDASERAHQISCLQSSPIDTMCQTTLGEVDERKTEDNRMVEELEEVDAYLPLERILLAEGGWYTSPEEVEGAPSSFSSDIYRLGVLLFELVCTFNSTKEKLGTMLNLRHRVLPPQLLLKWPKEASFCLWLLHPQSSTRPKLSELLQSEFLNEPREEVEAMTHLGEKIEEQEVMLEFLSQIQQQKMESADELHNTIGCLSSDIEEVLQKQLITKQGETHPEPNDGDRSTSKNVDNQSRNLVTNEHSATLGSRKRLKLGRQVSVENRARSYSDDIQKSESLARKQEHARSKSTRLMKNFKKLESVYFSTRSRMINTTEKFLKGYSEISSSSKGSIVINGGSSVNNLGFNMGNNKARKTGWINPFLEGLNSYLSFTNLKVRTDLNLGDLLNSSNLICSISFDRDRDFFATAGVARKIKVFDYHMILNEDQDIHYPVIEMTSKSKLSSICWNNYIKSQIASCDFEGVVQIWDAAQGQVFTQMTEHERRVWSVDFSLADPTKLASGGDDGAVKLWNINQGGSIGTIRTKANVCCVQFPPDSARSLVFGSADHKIYCYDLRNTRMPWCTLVGHGKTVSYVKFVDSTTLVSSSIDNSLKLWDLSTCTSQVLDRPIQTFTGHTNVKNFVGLSICDGYIATGSETDEVFVYHKTFPMPMLSSKFSNGDSLSGQEADDPTQFVSSVCWHGQSSTLVAANSTGNIKLLEMV